VSGLPEGLAGVAVATLQSICSKPIAICVSKGIEGPSCSAQGTVLDTERLKPAANAGSACKRNGKPSEKCAGGEVNSFKSHHWSKAW